MDSKYWLKWDSRWRITDNVLNSVKIHCLSEWRNKIAVRKEIIAFFREAKTFQFSTLTCKYSAFAHTDLINTFLFIICLVFQLYQVWLFANWCHCKLCRIINRIISLNRHWNICTLLNDMWNHMYGSRESTNCCLQLSSCHQFQLKFFLKIVCL